MATSKTFFGLRRGSTKSLTFAVDRGQQITKDRVRIIKNNRSEGQMVQRALMKTVGAASSVGKRFFNHSFEGVNYGAQSLAMFRALNMTNLRKALPEVNIVSWETKEALILPNEYIVSKGSLPPAKVHLGLNEFHFGQIAPDSDEDAKQTFKSLEELLQYYAVQKDDIMTILAITSDGRLRWCRATFNGTLDDECIIFEHDDEFGWDCGVGYNPAADARYRFVVRWEYGDSLPTQATATIISRKTKKGWLRSTEKMKVELVTDKYDQEGNVELDDYNFTKAITTYPHGKSFILNGGK